MNGITMPRYGREDINQTSRKRGGILSAVAIGILALQMAGCAPESAPSLSLSADNAEASWSSESIQNMSGSLRSSVVPIDASEELFIAGADVTERDTTLWSAKAKLEGDKWNMDRPKEIDSEGCLFAFYPDKGFNIDENDNIFYAYTPGDKPLLYSRQEYGRDNSALTVTLKNLMVKFTVRLDFSDYGGGKHIESIAVGGAPWRANINIKTGQVFYVEDYDYVPTEVNKTIEGDSYDYEFYSFPMTKGLMPGLKLKMDGKIFTIDLFETAEKEWKSGENYLYTAKVKALGEYTPVIVAEEVRSDDKMEVYDITEAPYFRLASTSGQWHVLPKDQTAVMGIFLENNDYEDFSGDVRIVLEDLNHRVVQQGTYWSYFPIKSYEYDGLRIPILPRVPAGEYYIQVYCRKRGDSKWFTPEVMNDISVKNDFKVRIADDYPNVRFATAFWRDPDKYEGPFYESLISTVALNTPYRYFATLNSYEKTDKQATIRLYHYRNPWEDGYSAYQEPKIPKDRQTWKDLLAEERVTIKAGGQTDISMDYRFTVKRASVERFCGYLYATIQYDGGNEYPLIVDANNLYKSAQGTAYVSSPDGDDLWHYVAAFTQSTIHYVDMPE